jgi:hypothetical protein
MTDRTQTTYNQILGTREDGAIVVLDYTFVYGDNFHGATGAEIYPVSHQEIKEAMKEKREYLRETADDCDIHGEQRRALMAMPKAEYLDMRFEPFRDIPTEDIAAKLGVEEPERYTVSGIGRMFPRALEGLTILDGAQQYVDIIIAAESGNE